MKKFTLLLIITAVLMCGCQAIQNQDEKLNNLKRPVVVTATTPDGGVLVCGADGKVLLFDWDTYMGATLKNCKVCDIIAK